VISLRRLQDGWIEAQYCVERICGESKDVDESIPSEYKPELLELISLYEPKNIYSAYERRLFLPELPTKSLAVKGEKCTKGKTSKERLTVLLCGNMVGEMEKLP
jgi:hypothetical protein